MKNEWIRRMGSVRLGIVLLVLVALAVVIGTVIIQKPLAEPGQIENLYSPTKLKIYGALGLLDLFHTWWFTALLALMILNIGAASLQRFPVVWREVRRHREPDEELMRAMQLNATVSAPVEAVADALRHRHYRVQVKQLPGGRRGLTADKQRYARLAPYFVHLSLLIILVGGIVDSRFGYRGFMQLNVGEQKAVARRMASDSAIALPYAIRCDGAGMEQYPDGSPKRYWSRLTVLEDGRDVMKKEIEVNSPLVYRGIRFFQSSYGRSGSLERVQLSVSARKAEEANPAAPGSPHGDAGAPQAPPAGDSPGRLVELTASGPTEIPEYGLRVRLAGFYPDFYMDGNQIATRSDEPNNPALKLEVTKGEETIPVWVFANYPQFSNTQKLPVRFGIQDLQLGTFTGLQVTNQPGQWLVWLGSTVLAFGFVWAFFFAHRQFWALELPAASGPATLVSGMTGKQHEEFRDEFKEFIESVKEN